MIPPSVEREGLSISVLEAMALGKPIVATTIGGNLELLDNGACGLVVPPHDVDRLAEAILGLALDPAEAARLGTAALERFEQCFTEQTMKDALWAAYRPLLLTLSPPAASRTPASLGPPV